MDIHQLTIFAAVYRSRSFSRASDHLKISQPTISEHIKNLEQELNTRLFDRLPRTIIPTEDAHLMYPRCMHILDETKKLKEEMTLMDKKLMGTVQIGASTIPGTYILPEEAAVIKKTYPGLLFEILIDDSRNISQMVLDHTILLGVVGAAMEQDKLDFTPFTEDELICVAPRNMKIKAAISPAELSKYPFLIRENGSGSRKIMENYLANAGMAIGNLSIQAVLGSSAAIRQAVKAELGISIISKRAVREDIEIGAIKQVNVQGIHMIRNFYIVTHPKRTLPLSYEIVKGHLLRNARQE